MMNPARLHVESILREWKGEDAADQRTPSQIADVIDLEYREYLAMLAANAAAITAGQQAQERYVA